MSEKRYVATARARGGGASTVGIFSTEGKATKAGKNYFDRESGCYAIDILGFIVDEAEAPTMIRRVCERK